MLIDTANAGLAVVTGNLHSKFIYDHWWKNIFTYMGNLPMRIHTNQYLNDLWKHTLGVFSIPLQSTVKCLFICAYLNVKISLTTAMYTVYKKCIFPIHMIPIYTWSSVDTTPFPPKTEPLAWSWIFRTIQCLLTHIEGTSLWKVRDPR